MDQSDVTEETSGNASSSSNSENRVPSTSDAARNENQVSLSRFRRVIMLCVRIAEIGAEISSANCDGLFSKLLPKHYLKFVHFLHTALFDHETPFLIRMLDVISLYPLEIV